jgi:SP family sugar:H+ symporter-like MFS transporter
MMNTLLESAPSHQENTPLIVGISCVATLGGFLFGFDSGVINGTVDGLQLAFQSDSAGTGFNVASMLLGCAVGAFFSGRLADRHGRRTVMRAAAVLFLISAWGSGIAGSSLEFVIYRVLGGLAVGGASVMAPAYITEVTPARYRGALTTIQQTAIIVGLFTAFVSNYVLASVAGSATAAFWGGFEAWRWLFWMEMMPASVFLLGLMVIPETPRYLVVSRQRERAREVIVRLFGDALAEPKLTDIEASLAVHRHRPRLADLLDPATGRLRRLVWVGIGLATFQQLVGINVVFYYGAVLWQSVGFSESDALLINVLSGGLSIAACIITVLAIDRIGRKPLLMIGSVGMAVTLGIVTYSFASADVTATGTLSLDAGAGTTALIAANAYVFLFNMTWGPVMWVMLAEMFPNQLRGSGLAVSGLCQWASNFVITLTFPMLLAGIGLAGAYGLYALSAAVSIVFVGVMVRETRGIELEAMPG